MPFTQGATGRDHNGGTSVAWLAGAGIKAGVAHGESDDWAWKAAEDQTYCYDLHATILHLLGIDHTHLTFRHNGIDRRLTDVHGHVIERDPGVIGDQDGHPLPRGAARRARGDDGRLRLFERPPDDHPELGQQVGETQLIVRTEHAMRPVAVEDMGRTSLVVQDRIRQTPDSRYSATLARTWGHRSPGDRTSTTSSGETAG